MRTTKSKKPARKTIAASARSAVLKKPIAAPPAFATAPMPGVVIPMPIAKRPAPAPIAKKTAKKPAAKKRASAKAGWKKPAAKKAVAKKSRKAPARKMTAASVKKPGKTAKK